VGMAFACFPIILEKSDLIKAAMECRVFYYRQLEVRWSQVGMAFACFPIIQN